MSQTPQPCDVVVIGAGMAGASVAAFLAAHVRVAVVEREAGTEFPMTPIIVALPGKQPAVGQQDKTLPEMQGGIQIELEMAERALVRGKDREDLVVPRLGKRRAGGGR